MLWEFTPDRGLQLSRPLDGAQPIEAYLKALGKYRHLSAEQVEHIEKSLERNVALIRGFARNRQPQAVG